MQQVIREENKVLTQENSRDFIRAFYTTKNTENMTCIYFSQNNYLKLILNHQPKRY